jgi:vacuolar protein sorting-associated protein 26
MASWLPVLQAGVDADILLYGEDERKVVEVKGEKDRRETCPVYYDGEGVKGQASWLMIYVFVLAMGGKLTSFNAPAND